MSTMRQMSLLVLSAVRSLPNRAATVLVTALGVLIVVCVFTSLLALGDGVRSWVDQGARADRAFVLSRGAAAAPQSLLQRDVITNIFDAPGVRHDAAGEALALASSMAFVDVLKTDHTRANIYLIGMTRQGLQVFPEIHVIRGRPYRSGMHELIVSESAQKMYSGFEIGSQIPLRGAQWSIVGVFADTGGVFDSVLFADGETLVSAFRRKAFQQVTVMLDSAADFNRFKASLLANTLTPVDVYTETDIREAPVRGTRYLLDFVSYFVGTLMAIGSICTALSSQYAAVDARRREIATLRAIGFTGTPILGAVVLECLLIALPAAVLGAALAWLLFNGHVASTSGLTFPLAVSTRSIGLGIACAVLIGLVGGALPAIRAMRVSAAEALRAS